MSEASFTLMSKALKGDRGFTLIEILVAIAIISIVTVTVVPNLRKFNSDQELSNDTNKLIQTLRQAQSNAQSGLKCLRSPTATASANWMVGATNSATFYIQPTCNDANLGLVAPAIEKTTYTLTNTRITVNSTGVGTCLLSQPQVTFTKNIAAITNGCQSNPLFTLTHLVTNNTKSVSVDPGGAIYEKTN